MEIIKSLAAAASQDDKIVESLSKQAHVLVSLVPVARLGILEDYKKGEVNTHVGKGDIVIHPDEKAAYVATGNADQTGRFEIMNKHKRRMIHPELVTVGSRVADPVMKKAAGRLATEHPTRKVHVYGSLPKKEKIGEATTNLDDNPLPSKDKGIASTWKAPKSHNDTTKGGEVHNDEEQFITSMKQAGKVKKHKLGDKDAGNPKPDKKDA